MQHIYNYYYYNYFFILIIYLNLYYSSLDYEDVTAKSQYGVLSRRHRTRGSKLSSCGKPSRMDVIDITKASPGDSFSCYWHVK